MRNGVKQSIQSRFKKIEAGLFIKEKI